jgi:hypothetical protein
MVTEAQQALLLFAEVKDPVLEAALSCNIVGWGWLDLGDGEGVRQRFLAMAPHMLQQADTIMTSFWRHVLARALCDSESETAWAQAEELVAPMLVQHTSFAAFQPWAHGILSRVALQRGQRTEAEEHARIAVAALPLSPSLTAQYVATLIHVLLAQGRPTEAVEVAEQTLITLRRLGSFGSFEVEFRVAASEACHTAGHPERARAELHETLRQIKLRADDITDPFWKQSYLGRNPSCVRAQALAKKWGLSYAP